jgi:replication factor A1
VLQVIEIHEMKQPNRPKPLYMLCLSDGQFFTSSMLTACSAPAMEGPLAVKPWSLVQLQEWECQVKVGTQMVFVRALSHVALGQGRIGEPVQLPIAGHVAPPAHADRREDILAMQPTQPGQFDPCGPPGNVAAQQGQPAQSGAADQMGRPMSMNPYEMAAGIHQQVQQPAPPASIGGLSALSSNPYQQQALPAATNGGGLSALSANPYQGSSAAGLYGGAAATVSNPYQQQVQQQQQPPQQQPAFGALAPPAARPPAPWHTASRLDPAAPPQQPTGWMEPHRQQTPLHSYGQPTAGGGGGTTLSRSGSSAAIDERCATTVAAMSPYNQKFNLLLRVTKKNSIRTFKYKNGREGEGQLFSVELIDRAGGETRGTFFGAAVDKFFELLQERRTYTFSGGRVKTADRRWVRNAECEITFEENSVITPVEDDGAVPQMVFDFKLLSNIAEVPKGASVDIAAIVIEAESAQEVPLRAGGTKLRINVTLIDDSGVTCRLTLWGDQASLPWCEGEVALLKGVKTSDFGGCSLSGNFGSAFLLGEDAVSAAPRASELKQWFLANGTAARGSARSLSSEGPQASAPQPIAETKAEAARLEGPSPGGQAPSAYHTISPATVTFMSHDRQPFYFSCPAEVPDTYKNEAQPGGPQKMRTCMRKTERFGDVWRCSADHTCEKPTPRWVLSFDISDHTSSQYVSAFDEAGKSVLGCDASEAAALWEQRDTDMAAAARFEELFKAAQFKRRRMRLRSRKEMWNDEERVKVSLLECRPVAFPTDGRRMLSEIKAAIAGDGGA